jgi:hypothetical protein
MEIQTKLNDFYRNTRNPEKYNQFTKFINKNRGGLIFSCNVILQS